jgi:hypothetical protein
MGNDKVALTLKLPWSDGTTRLVFTPLEFVQRLIRMKPSCDHGQTQTDVGEAGAPNKGGHKADEHQSTIPSAHSDCRHQSPASKSKSLGWAKSRVSFD